LKIIENLWQLWQLSAATALELEDPAPSQVKNYLKQMASKRSVESPPHP
jgi:hypothetical protein